VHQAAPSLKRLELIRLQGHPVLENRALLNLKRRTLLQDLRVHRGPTEVTHLLDLQVQVEVTHLLDLQALVQAQEVEARLQAEVRVLEVLRQVEVAPLQAEAVALVQEEDSLTF
jgi:adenine-specific DNA methylase